MQTDHEGLRLFSSNALVVFLSLIGLAAAIGLTGCGDDFFSENTVLDANVEPSSIPKSDTGMGDEYFTVTVDYRGFDGGITEAGAFIQNPEPGGSDVSATIRDGSLEVYPDESRLEFETLKSWFSGFDPGTYSIGATISGTTSDGLDVESTRRGLAQVTITE